MGKKRDILETAIRLFVDQGFDSTPTSQISKEADVATGTLFHYFKTKEDLINNAFLYASEKSIERLGEYNGEDFKSYLKELWFSGMEWALNHRYYVKFMSIYSNSVYITKLTLDNAGEILQPYYEIMEVGIKSGKIIDLPVILLINTYNCIFTVFFNHLEELDVMDHEIVSEGFSVVWNALKNE